MIAKASKEKGRARKLFKESHHLDAEFLSDSNSEDKNNDDEDDDFLEKEQDYHAMLSVFLEDLVQLQATGFIWDLKYRGKVYKDVEFVVFVPFVKCDTDEAEKLCGKYRCRTGNVKHIC